VFAETCAACHQAEGGGGTTTSLSIPAIVGTG
jgi:mono/diheme cytochrome c family protein